MNPLVYALILIVPGLAALGLSFGGLWTFAAPLLVFGLVPAAELVSPLHQMAEESAVSQGSDRPLYAAAAAHFALLTLFLVVLAGANFAPWELAGIIVSMGLSCGGLAINLGHELGHRRDRFDQRLAKVLLSTSLYVHFFIEHNRGHHARVGTPTDPASARRGESLYRFWPRSFFGGWISAWRLERDRLLRRGHKTASLGNEMIRWQVVQLGLLAAIGLSFGLGPLLAFCAAALIGVLLLETVNYLEHYGLTRGRADDGRLEPVRRAHSWNSNSLIGRVLLFELPRHSDHHAHPKRTYTALRHFEDAPQLPTGYPGMILLALFPPAFFAVMHPRLPEPEHTMRAA